MRHRDGDIPVRCPRCGYDQRGVTMAWTESCPLQGTCSECGLIFNWAEVICPAKFEPPWCVEFVPRRRSIPAACVKTFVRSFWPWAFWSRLKMSQPIRKWRLAAYCVLLLVPFLFCYVAGQAVLAIYIRARVQQQTNTWPQQIATTLGWHQEYLSALQLAQQISGMTAEQRDQALSTLPSVQFLSAEQFRSQVELFASYSPGALAKQTQVYQQQIAAYQAQAVAPPVIKHSYFEAVWEMIASPFSPYSSGVIQFADGTLQPYPAPVLVYQSIFGSVASPWGAFNLLEDPLLRALAGVLSAILLTLAFPATFILLPASRRRAKVRWAHVTRVLVYSLFAMEALLLVLIVAGLLRLLTGSEAAMWIIRHAPFAFWIVLPLWWAVAIKRYFKMLHSAAVAVVMTFMLALLMTPLLAFVFPPWIVRFVLD